jgi:hypothetical protein
MIGFEAALRAAARVLGGDFQARIFFLHVPKCGGTSVSHSIRNCYNFFERIKAGRYFDQEATYNAAKMLDPAAEPFSDTVLKIREYLLIYFMNEKKVKYIPGHFSFSDFAYNEFGNRFAFITVLRNPVERWTSTYFHAKSKGKVESDLSDFIESELGKAQGFEIVRYIGGLSSNGDYVSPGAIERAKANLHKFHIVGMLEYPDDFVVKFKMHFGVDLKLPKLNETRRDLLIDKDLKFRISEICRPDIEVYRYAVEKFVNQKPET